MNPLIYYISGEEVHAGDRVQHDGGYATVVFVSDGDNEEYAPGYQDYSGADRGVVLCDDDGSLSTLAEPNEQLSLLDRN